MNQIKLMFPHFYFQTLAERFKYDNHFCWMDPNSTFLRHVCGAHESYEFKHKPIIRDNRCKVKKTANKKKYDEDEQTSEMIWGDNSNRWFRLLTDWAKLLVTGLDQITHH